MAKFRTQTYVIGRMDGSIETLRVPALWDCYEVVKRLPHDLVFMVVNKGFSVYAMGTTEERMYWGPCTVFVDPKTDRLIWVPKKPTTEHEAFRLWKDYVQVRETIPICA